jgi:hypothetical protein
MLIELVDILDAITNASQRRQHRKDFAPVLDARYDYAQVLLTELNNNTWQKRISYNRGEVTNVNGKHRVTYQPKRDTLILQHLCILKLLPYYKAQDSHAALNCKKGCGLTTKDKPRSVVHRLKHIFYDRHDLNFLLKLDQRKCYEHIRPSVMRKALKRANVPTWLGDMAITLGFVDGKIFPVGTPLSPLLHHFLMLSTDKLIRQMSPTSVRYADDVILFFADKTEAQQAKWRIKNLWWYELGMRSKRGEAIIQPMTEPIDFCGTIYHRNKNKGVHAHNKGYCTTRKSTVARAKKCTAKSYPSYFGLLKSADNFKLLTTLEKQMELPSLTDKIRIDRKLDAPNIDIKELASQGIEFCVHEYDLRKDKNGNYNWIKLLISFKDKDKNRRIVRETHGDFQGIIAYHLALEQVYPDREFLPLTKAVIDNCCGYIYRGSTNMMTEIPDSAEFN